MLAEYEKGKMTWMGNLESWTNTSAMAADVNVLPTDETGWMTYADSNTEHAGYYNTYYDINRGVVFNDEASSSTVNVAEDIVTPSMEVNNTNLAYTFDGGETAKTITVDEFTKKGSGSVVFNKVKLLAGTATLEGDVTFDELEVTGTLNASGKRIHANDITLGGDATIGSIGNDGSNYGLGTTNLTITGGKTTIENSWAWTNLKSLTMSDSAQLKVGASLSVSGNICSTGEPLPTSGTADINTTYCLYVGTEGDANTGKVDLAGNITAGAYIKILGDATVTGNITTTKDYIEIDGKADIGGNLNAGSGYITLGKGGKVGGTITGSIITLKDSTTMARIADNANLVVSGGTAEVEYSKDWTKLNNLSLSDTATLKVGASLSVAGNLSYTGETLPASGTATINPTWCLTVGTEGDANTGKVDLAGNITAGAYIKILGDATVTGNVTTTKDYIEIDGKANIGGNLNAGSGHITLGKDAKIDGNIAAGEKATFNGKLTMAAGKSLTAKSLEVKGDLTGGAGDTKASLTTTEGMTLGGNASNVALEAQTVTVAEGVTLDSVDMVVKSGNISLTNVTIQGESSFSTGTDGGILTLNANGVTFVLEAPPAQTFAMFSANPLTETQTSSNPLLISSSMLEGLDIQGSVTFDLTNWQSEIESGLYDSVVLDLENSSFSGEKDVQITLGNEVLAQMTPDAGNTGSFTIALPQKPDDAVPEPTTSTLSLLALAALAARRRRK